MKVKCLQRLPRDGGASADAGRASTTAGRVAEAAPYLTRADPVGNGVQLAQQTPMSGGLHAWGQTAALTEMPTLTPVALG